MPNVRTLADSNAEALRALESISQRLGSVLVDANEGLGLPSNNGTRRVEKKNLVNEEGLPFVEIMEPVDELDTPSLTAASDEMVNEHHPEPLSKLSPEALALNRQRRDNILQMLEEEEEREDRRTEEQRKEELRRQRELARNEMEKRMLNQGFELERRRKAKELEVRMAKALVQNGGGGSSNKQSSSTVSSESEKKKKVTFAEPDKKAHGDPVQTQRLDDLPRSKLPMKMEVVERVPANLLPPPPASTSKHQSPQKSLVQERFPVNGPEVKTSMVTLNNCERDSDNGREAKRSMITFTDRERDSDDESEPDDSIDSAISMENLGKDVSISHKMHHELTLEYQKKRATLKFDPGDVLNLSSWNEENVPLQASLAQPMPKPFVSKFKQFRIKQKTPKSSTTGIESTFETAVMPTEILAKNIRMGKVVSGELVGDEEETD